MTQLPDKASFRKLIDDALSKDQHNFNQRLNKLFKTKDSDKLLALLTQIKRSAGAAGKRGASCPALTYPDLPISDK